MEYIRRGGPPEEEEELVVVMVVVVPQLDWQSPSFSIFLSVR